MIQKAYFNSQKKLPKILFSRNLDELGFYFDRKGSTIDRPNDNIVKINYEINSHGYRSEEFEDPADVVVLGCSQTFGAGMHKKYIWPEVFSNTIKKQYHNLATPGDSAQGQVYKAFKYFEEIGNPKIVVGCFPLLRIETPLIPGRLEKIKKNRYIDIFGIEMAYINGDTLVDFSKSPHDPECVLPPEVAIFYNFMFIQMLEQYCKSHGIIFIWALWDNNHIISEAKNNSPSIFKNYVLDDISYYQTQESKLFYKDKVLSCHEELKEHLLFNYGSDHSSEFGGHWGIHMHAHISEIFMKKYESLINV